MKSIPLIHTDFAPPLGNQQETAKAQAQNERAEADVKRRGARQRAGEFEKRELAVCGEDSGEVFRLGSQRDAGFGDYFKCPFNTKAVLNRIDPRIEKFQGAGHPEDIASIGELPEPAAQG